MKPSQAVLAAKHCFEAGKRPMLWGPPGVGKTSVLRALAASLGINLITVHGNVLDPADAHGFPVTVHRCEKGKLLPVFGTEREILPENLLTLVSRPSFWPQGDEGIIFLDEFCAAPTMSQNAFSQLLLDGRIGDHILPKGWNIALASNRIADRAGVQQMPTMLANRVIHLDFEVDLDDFHTWGIANGLEGVILGFLRSMPQHLHDQEFAKEGAKKKSGGERATEHAFRSPRAWEFVSDILKTNPPQSIEQDMIAGTVGKEGASDFATFLKLFRKAPSLDEIVLNPTKAKVPEELHIKYAVAIGLSRKMEKLNMRAILTYLERLPVDMAVMSVKTATERDKSITETKLFGEFIIKHKQAMGLEA